MRTITTFSTMRCMPVTHSSASTVISRDLKINAVLSQKFTIGAELCQACNNLCYCDYEGLGLYCS